MTKQPEALLIADEMDDIGEHQVAAELRRLHEVNAELVEALRYLSALVSESTLREMADDAIAKVTGEQQ